MSQRSRQIAGNFFAWCFLVMGFFLAGSVLSQDPTIPSRLTTYREPPPTSNLFGQLGDEIAANLYDVLGVGAYGLIAGLLILVFLRLQRKSLASCFIRMLGWMLLIPCISVFAEFGFFEDFWEFRSGPGGSLGAWLSVWLQEGVSAAIGLILLGGCVFFGLVLAMDFLLLSLFRNTVSWAWFLSKLILKECLRFVTLKRPKRKSTRRLKESSSSLDHSEDEPEIEEAEKDQQPLAELIVPDKSETQVPIVRPKPVPQEAGFENYELPSLSLLEDPDPFPFEEHDQFLRDRAALLEKTFKDFDLNVRVVGINTGPVITQYEVSLETGLRLHKVTRLADDISLNLKVASVRMVAPIPGKNTVGVEIPNEHRATVRLKEVILTAGKKIQKMQIPLFLGKDTEGRPLCYDLSEMPHLLIAGRTGTGKSVCMNSIILSMLMTRRPDEIKMVMIDPKMLELSEYGEVPHLMHPVVKDMKKAEAILAWAVEKMEERYELLSRARVRGIAGYNQLKYDEILKRVNPEPDERDRIPQKMPYIVIFVDEMGDLMMSMKREVEGHIIRLAQKSRAAGIHLVVATQKPTVDVITGLIKSNLPARICFQVASRSDSRVVLDEMGAEKLLGKGDMLFLQPGTSTVIRAQGTYASDQEITQVVESIDGEPEFAEELLKLGTSKDGGSLQEQLKARDEVYEPAIEVVIREQRGSVSLLQRALGIGYGRAARLIDFMAEDGIVGAYKGSSAREVLFTPEEWEEMKQGQVSQQV